MDTLNTLPSTSRINALFRKSMSSLYLNSWVSSWSFDNLAFSPFHVDHVIPTQAFSHVLLISCYTRFEHAFLSRLFYRQFEGHLGFVPVHEKDNITVGYGIHVGSDSENYANSTDRVPFAPPYVSRIVMDHNTKTMVLIKPCLEYNLITIHALNVETSSSETFIIPFNNYNWDYLPDSPPIVIEGAIVLFPFSNVDETKSGINHSQRESIQLNDINLTPNDIRELMTTLTTSSSSQNSSASNRAQPSSASMIDNLKTDSTESLDNDILSKRNTESLPYLSGQQQINFRNDALLFFQDRAIMLGERTDTNEVVIPGYDALTKLRDMHTVFEIPDFQTQIEVSSKYAIIYYSTVLSVTTDGPLLLPNPSDRILTVAHFMSNQQTHQGSDIIRNKDRETLLRRRKERNRLSARRSNAKKKEYELAMMRELEVSKTHILDLEEKQTLLWQQNDQLKTLVNTICFENSDVE